MFLLSSAWRDISGQIETDRFSTVRTMIAEISTKKTQAKAFSYFAVGSTLGIFIGPLIGMFIVIVDTCDS